eukprot:10320760-Alexandrium_andersonii.AAC.1
MSASLVGSEMCIRDRCCSSLLAGGQTAAWSVRARAMDTILKGVKGGGGGCLLYTSDAADDM